MNDRTILVFDCHYLCHRAWHAVPDLSWLGRPTEVIYGFLQSVSLLRNHFATDDVVFCFEDKHSLRRDVFPDYKRKREQKRQEDPKARKQFNIQIERLRNVYLPDAGFHNVLCLEGLESDDIMAAIARDKMFGKEDVILVTGDSDLFQCLSAGVSIYSPHHKKVLNQRWFEAKYGILPQQWARVKAMAGCHTDNVPGIPGIGETRALQFLRGELKKTSAAYQSIMSESGREVVRRNRQLVELPFSSCPKVTLAKEDGWNERLWRRMLQSLGIRSRI